MSLQSRCDALAYPPTHVYDIDTLTPKGPLAERAAIIERLAPDLFTGERFLDIGCNKGWFSLEASLGCKKVVGLDPNPDFIDLCRGLAATNCEFQVASFGKATLTGTFDRIFLGNGPHYPFVEAGGWDFVERLAALSSGVLVTEGPVGLDCADMLDCIPGPIAHLFNTGAFFAAMQNHWRLRAQAPSPSYTPNRYIMVWDRIDDLINCDMARYADYLRIVYARMGEWIDASDTVVEVCIRHDRGVISRGIITCDQFDGLDLNPGRCPFGGYQADAVRGVLPKADVYISTAILHHTAPDDIEPLLRNLHKHAGKRAIFTGPDVRVLPNLEGDHKWQIDLAKLAKDADEAGWRVVAIDGIGLNAPYSEVFVVMDRL